jgi:uncharacterized protein with NRDE domain
MCLIAFAINEHPDFPFILIANRDEFYDRPSLPAHFWPEHPHMLAGKDLKAGGTWLGITLSGRFAAITNYRDIKNINPAAKSRGEIIKEYLTSEATPAFYMQSLQESTRRYNGYNLLIYDNMHISYYSNNQNVVHKIDSGVHGLSNAFLNTSWHKVQKIKKEFNTILKNELNENRLFEILADESTAEKDLPRTGLPYDLEKAVSAIHIRTDNYGTVSTTIVMIAKNKQATFIEKTHAVGGRQESIKRFNFLLSNESN